MNAREKISAAIADAQRQLAEIGVPVDPDQRWSRLSRSRSVRVEQVSKRVDEVADYLYNVVTYGRRALAARDAGDWDAYTDALEIMIGQQISSRLPRIRATLHRQRQRTAAKHTRSANKQTAQDLFTRHAPKDAKTFATLVAEAGIDVSLKTVQNWFSEFAGKKNSR